ncbi:MAG: efflux RND transporter periplasmic adaptor subunit [Chitinophagales bacterium]
MKKLIIKVLPALLLLAACNNKSTNPAEPPPAPELEKVVAIGRIEPATKISSIGTQVNGVIKHLYVQDGDSVKKGAALLELAHDYEDAQLKQAQAKLVTQQADIENVKAQLASAEIKAKNLGNRLQRVKNMVQQGAETQQTLDNTQTDYDQAATDINRYSAALQAAEAQLAERKTDVAVIQSLIAQKIIAAPDDGCILNVNVTEGAAVTTNKSLLDFAPNAPLTVFCEVDELFADKVKTGQKAFVRNQGAQENLAEGEVVYVSSYLSQKSLFSDDSGNMEDRRVRQVRILINSNAQLLFGARVEVIIETR